MMGVTSLPVALADRNWRAWGVEAFERIDRVDVTRSTWSEFVDAHHKVGMQPPPCGIEGQTPIVVWVVAGRLRDRWGDRRPWVAIALDAIDASTRAGELPPPTDSTSESDAWPAFWDLIRTPEASRPSKASECGSPASRSKT